MHIYQIYIQVYIYIVSIYNSVNLQLSLVKFRGQESHNQSVFPLITKRHSKQELKRS